MSILNQKPEELRQSVQNLPHEPGVYQYFDIDGKLIYVGKAKDLKKRVLSYFNKDKDVSSRIILLVKKIHALKYIVVKSEYDALLLENNLIKEHQPRYNIQMKDDKSFPFLVIRNEAFPRVHSMRNPVKDGSSYFGPYASARNMRNLLDLIRKMYPIRTCSYDLSAEKIKKAKYKVCLEYHLGNCLGPCEGKQSPEDYSKNLEEIKQLIKGNIGSLIRDQHRLMMDYAGEQEFEKAQQAKEKIEMLKQYQGKSTVVNPAINHVDVFSIVHDKEAYFVNYLKIVSGAIVQSHTVELKKKLDEQLADLLIHAIIRLRSAFQSHSEELIVPFDPGIPWEGIKLTVPKIGDKKKLLDLSEKNARVYSIDQRKKKDLVDPSRHSRRITEQLQKDLRMKKLPHIIECFDNSNLQGSEPVAAMVQFVETKPNKKQYRHYNIRSVEGPNDFASMEEIIHRRYQRLLAEDQPLPDLIVVDGGKGQLSAAVKSLDVLGLRGKITIIGIAKRLEEIYFPDDPIPVYINKKSESLKLIQQLRDEAHRFGITHHRGKRSKSLLKTELSQIEGIGSVTAAKLLKHFRSVKRVAAASLQDLQPLIGPDKSQKVFDYFRN